MTSAITRIARHAWSRPFSPARIRSATGPRLTAGSPTSTDPDAVTSSPSGNAESASCMPGFLQHGVIEIGADDVLELRVHAFGGLAIVVAVDLDDRHALGLVTLRDL